MVVNEAASAGAPIVIVDNQISEVVINGKKRLFSTQYPRDSPIKSSASRNDKLHAAMSKTSTELAARVLSCKQAIKIVTLIRRTIEQHEQAKIKSTSR